MTQKRTPARRKATGNRDTTTGPSASVPHNWPDTGTMPKPERVPTGSGERKRTRLVGPRTRGQVRRRASGERTKGRPRGRMDARRASRKSLPEPVAVEAARPVPRGRGRSNASPLPDRSCVPKTPTHTASFKRPTPRREGSSCESRSPPGLSPHHVNSAHELRGSQDRCAAPRRHAGEVGVLTDDEQRAGFRCKVQHQVVLVVFAVVHSPRRIDNVAAASLRG